MFKSISVYASFNTQTGYGIHASRFAEALENFIPVKRNNPTGDIVISLFDIVTASHNYRKYDVPSVLYSVWESTKYPDKFMRNLQHYDMLWVPSEWQRQCSIKQGCSEGFVKVIPEGVDPNVFVPLTDYKTREMPTFDFLIVGKWEDRKSTKEMIRAWIDTFPIHDFPKMRLHISADNPFPVDKYTTTEERIIGYQLIDPRLRIVHFESHEAHLDRLKKAHIYLSCSRAEGWNLPLIEAMACGIPSIALDHSGSTEFAKDAILVRVKEYIKPFNVYGMPDCPGLWAEPDWHRLKKVMRYAYKNYQEMKEKAIETSDYIRTEFSWKKAAEKALVILQDLEERTRQKYATPEIGAPKVELFNSDSKVEITHPDEVFVVGCWPSSQERLNTLIETMGQIRALGYPILISTHYPVPAPVMQMADYFIFEKANILSGDWHPTYTRVLPDGKVEQKETTKQYHAVACLNAIRNAIDFCKGRFEKMYYMEFDLEVDLPEWIAKVETSDGKVSMLDYEGTGFRSDFFAGDPDDLDLLFPYIHTWYEYMLPKYNYVLENWLKSHFEANKLLDKIAPQTIEITNRFDQVDRDIWPDDIFQYHFIEGPFLHISGLSNRVYDVSFQNPIDGVPYKVKQRVGTWSRPHIKCYRDWMITAKLDGEVKFQHIQNMTDKRVLISLGSKALGDTLAWAGYVEEFRKKHNCHIIFSCWWNDMLDYPEWEMVPIGSSVPGIYAQYEIGCYDEDKGYLNPNPWRTVPLQQVASDILGLPFTEVRPKLKLPPVEDYERDMKTMCFSEFSTMKPKLWNLSGGWQQIINRLKDRGYRCISISKEKSHLKGVISHNDQPIQKTMADMLSSEFYLGMGHGPSWLAWALKLPVVLISGFSEPWCEFTTPYRVINTNVCHGCFNATDVKLDRGWDWCPRAKDYECTKQISVDMVMMAINQLRDDRCLL